MHLVPVGYLNTCLYFCLYAIITLSLSHSTGGLYVQSGDNINSQDNSYDMRS